MSASEPTFCRLCGARLTTDLRYCPECGSPVTPPAAQPQPPDIPFTGSAAPPPAVTVPGARRAPRGLLPVIFSAAALLAVAALGWLAWYFSVGRTPAQREDRPLATTVQISVLRTVPPTSPTQPAVTVSSAVTTAATRAPATATATAATSTPWPTPAGTDTAGPPSATAVQFGPIPSNELRLSASQTAPDGVDSCGNAVAYPASNVIDGNPATAWRVLGDGVGSSLEIQLSRPYLVSEIALVIGYAKRDPCAANVDRWPQGYHITGLALSFDDGSVQNVVVSDSRELQQIRLPQAVRTERIRLLITSSREPSVDFAIRYTAISELSLVGAP